MTIILKQKEFLSEKQTKKEKTGDVTTVIKRVTISMNVKKEN